MTTIQAEAARQISSETAQRVAFLNRGPRAFHVVLAQQFDRAKIESLCTLSEMLRTIAATRAGAQFLQTLLPYRRAMLYFRQPSTRTFLSFTAACQVLGMPYNSVRERFTSSEVKGESEEDTIRVLSQYHDIIIMRHPAEGFAEHMAHVLARMGREVPVINAGSGRDQHPTQALLDIYTLFRCFSPPARGGIESAYASNPFAGKTIAFVGDLQRGRTVRSLAYLLCRYEGVKLLFVSPPELQIGQDILDHVERQGIEHEVSFDLAQCVERCDGLYITRLQDEWDVAGESKSIDYSRFHLTFEMAPRFKPTLAILHPLPRRSELDERIDRLPQAKYWEQVRNGMWMRAALMSHIFQVDDAVRDHFRQYYTY